MRKFTFDPKKRKAKAFAVSFIVYVSIHLYSYAQDGNAGIEDATTLVLGYFETGTTLMYAIGAVLGLIGAVKVYQNGTPATRTRAAWRRAGLSPAFSWLWSPRC